MSELILGSVAPEFSLVDHNSISHTLAEVKGKWLVLYFYPKDNTPGCTVEGIDFSRLREEFEKQGAVVWGVSPDSAKSHCSFMNKQNLTITLLSDESKSMLEKYQVWAKKKFMGKEYMGVLRTTFLIDSAGKIARIWRDVAVKGHAAEVLETLKKVKK